MSRAGQTLEERVEELSTRVHALELQLEHLTARAGGTDSAAPTRKLVADTGERDEAYHLGEPADVSEEVLTWVGRASLLPRLATLCFLLVVALVLRTITDSGLVNKLIGSGLGMSYATILMIVGWYQYRKQSTLAPVFAACGAILMSTIVVDTHTHFQSLPLVPAYLTLMATGIGMALISRQFKAFIPISVGVLGMCLAGAAIDYPRPFFPYLSLVLLTANLLGYVAAQLKRCSWLRWSVLFVTMVMLQLWGFRLGLALRRGEAVTPELALMWYLPILAAFFLVFLSLSLLGIVRGGTAKVSRFDFSLPTLNAVWAFTAAHYVVSGWNANTYLLGTIGVVAAAGHFMMTSWLARRGAGGAPGTNSFAVAGGALLVLALPPASGSFLLTLPVVSLAAMVLAIMSRVRENGGVRVTSYLLTIYGCVALAALLQGEGPGATDPIAMLPAGLLACMAIYQYQWCRRWPPPTASAVFSRFDQNDRTAVLLLFAGLVSGFYMMRVGIYQVVHLLPGEVHRDTFRCAQSVLINSSATALVIFAYLRRNREIRNVAILVTLMGAIQVFLYDLLGTHGLPLVFSVFSFGMAAAVESVVLGKWLKQQGEEQVPQ